MKTYLVQDRRPQYVIEAYDEDSAREEYWNTVNMLDAYDEDTEVIEVCPHTLKPITETNNATRRR